MAQTIKIVNVNDDSTYADITEAVVENEAEIVEEVEPVVQTEPEVPKPKARAKRVAKPKVVETEVEPTPEPTTPETEIKPKPKRVAKVKIVEQLLVVEPPIEKPKAVRKPRAKKETPTQGTQVPGFPPRLTRTAAREALYHSLASGALP